MLILYHSNCVRMLNETFTQCARSGKTSAHIHWWRGVGQGAWPDSSHCSAMCEGSVRWCGPSKSGYAMGDITEMHYRESWSNTQCTYRHAHAHARTHTHARTCTHTHTHMHMHTRACTHTHTHTHARTHTHTHTGCHSPKALCSTHWKRTWTGHNNAHAGEASPTTSITQPQLIVSPWHHPMGTLPSLLNLYVLHCSPTR